uniref:FAD-binding protein n=1 Tax=Gorillibacterium massiliense TaxID=1280390 RepID=UPI0005951DEC
MLPVISELQRAQAGSVLPDEPMSLHTTWKIGGPADVLVIPQTKEQLIRVLRILYEYDTPWFVLGRGSNLLVADSGIRGAVIRLGGCMQEARVEDHQLIAGGGFSFI